jgi:hypothetical protein
MFMRRIIWIICLLVIVGLGAIPALIVGGVKGVFFVIDLMEPIDEWAGMDG